MSGWTVAAIVAGYLALLLTVGWLAGRRGTFLTAGGKVPGWMVSCAMVGAAISGVTFVSVPGMVAAKGYSYLQMVMGFAVGYWLIAKVLIPAFYRRHLVSIYGYLAERFGQRTYRSGAWLFFVSKISGAAVRFLVACIVLQGLLFGPVGLPFEVSVFASLALVWLFTACGGVKSVIWTDLLRTAILFGGVIVGIWAIAVSLGLDLQGFVEAVGSHSSARVFYFDDPNSALYFWKQFGAGVFMAIAMTGLDQDMMQRTLGCGNPSAASRGMVRGGLLQLPLIALFMLLGTLLCLYVERTPGLEMPQKSDELFSLVATHEGMPVVVGVLFVAGLVATAWSAAGSAMTALTTSFTVDILGRKPGEVSRRSVLLTHCGMALGMAAIIIVFYHLSDQDAISAVYTLASYTYGPLLGLFALGMLTRLKPRSDVWVPVICVASPLLAWGLKWVIEGATPYRMGFELLLVNATVAALLTAVTAMGLPQPQTE